MNSPVLNFLQEQTFFVTGVTGFLGKVLLAKLLLTLPTLRENSIYVLVRGKKSVTATQRFAEMFSKSAVFQYIEKQRPDAIKAFKVIEGDVAKPNLGISPEDQAELWSKITCIIHMAATTTFTENLKLAFEINVMGTKHVTDLAKLCTKLKSMVYTSTCYANCTRKSDVIEEKIYPLVFQDFNNNVKELIEYVLSLSYEEADFQTQKFIGKNPNTYTFSKNIAEHLLSKEKGNLPVCIVRPSIIVSSMEFPFPGWVDSKLGASGLLLALGLGYMHSMVGGRENIADLIPVDYVVNTLLVAVWHTAQNPPIEKLPIYHSASSTKNKILWGNYTEFCAEYFKRNPIESRFIWFRFTKNQYRYRSTQFIFTKFPALISDWDKLIAKKPPTNYRGTEILGKTAETLSYFTSNTWHYMSHNTDYLYSQLNDNERKLFPLDFGEQLWEIWCIHFCRGLAGYLYKGKRGNNNNKGNNQQTGGQGGKMHAKM